MSGYVIHAGNYTPEKVLISHVDKRTGEPTGVDRFEAYITNGAQLILNSYIAWGRRIRNDERDTKTGKVKNEAFDRSPIEITDSKYQGDIEFLEYGDVKGQSIHCRYLTQSRSLDYEYQTNVQKVRVDPEGKDGTSFIELRTGENKYDYKKQGLLITYLKNHPQNRDAKSKNPDPIVKGHVFWEMTDEMVDKTSIDKMEAALDAGYFIKNLSNDTQGIRNLFEIVGQREEFGETNNLSNDSEIYKVLLKFAQEKPNEFNSLVDVFKHNFSDAIEIAKSFNALDLTKDGVIGFLLEGKKVIAFEGIEGKGNAMVEYVFNNYATEKVYPKIKAFITMTNKLKSTK